MHAGWGMFARTTELATKLSGLTACRIPAVDAALAVRHPHMEARRVARTAFARGGKKLLSNDLKDISTITALHNPIPIKTKAD